MSWLRVNRGINQEAMTALIWNVGIRVVRIVLQEAAHNISPLVDLGLKE